MRVGRRGRGNDLLPAGPGGGVRDVLGDADGKEHGLLEHDGELPAKVVEPVVPQVHPVQQDLALGRIVEAREEADERGLARTGRADDPQVCPGLDLEGDVVQDGTILGVGEGDVAEGDGATRARKVPGRRPLFDIRPLIEQGEGALGTGQMKLQARGFPADGLERLIELGEVAHHHEQLAQGEHARPDVADADQEHGRRAGRRGQPDQEVVAPLEPGQAHVRPRAVPGAAEEAPFLACLLTERLDDPQRAQDLLHDRQGGALERLDVP